MAKVLIIKLGYSETLDPEIGKTSSLGDVLRTTVLLSAFRNDHVTWLVDQAAYPLLEGNPYIKRILVYDVTSVLQLQHERFDTVVNLEKVPGVCALADSVRAWRRYGFRFDEMKGEAEAYDRCEYIFSLCKDTGLKKARRASWQESLLELVGAKWEGQEYILGYKPATREKYDVGLNWAVGSKWPNKAWPREKWKELKGLLGGKYTWSMQEGLDDIRRYIDWINQCRVLVTNDSLGLHIALALKKKVVVLYGPTNPNETYFYGRAEVLFPDVRYNCLPCLSPNCVQRISCMDFISPLEVMKGVTRLLKKKR
jgi:heptosyltransferase-2